LGAGRPRFKTIEDATDIRCRLLTFVVTGAGPTGVELAGAMVELARHAMPREFRRIDLQREWCW
jgi:NADH:ubiquinone reductase (H+-translocating)